jgi:hypothetical protein
MCSTTINHNAMPFVYNSSEKKKKKKKMREIDDASRRWKLMFGSRRSLLFVLIVISEQSRSRTEGFVAPPPPPRLASIIASRRRSSRQQLYHDLKQRQQHRIVANQVATDVIDAVNDHGDDDDDDEHGSVSSASAPSSSPSSSSSSSVWEAGDVYHDLEVLERAIARSNAAQNLERHERMEMLNQFAQERRVLSSDVYRWIGRPLQAGLALTMLQLVAGTSLAPTRRLLSVLDHVAMTHFRLAVLLTPILLWLSIQRRQRKIYSAGSNRNNNNNNNNNLPAELQGLDPEYFRFVVTTHWQDPRTSCQDHVLCLVEQWVSVILGSVLVEVFLMVLCRTTTAAATTTPLAPRLLQQLVTRFAVVASLHQYPKLWFQLNRTQQPRPVTWPTFALQTAISMLATRWFMTWNLARLLVIVVSALTSLSRSWPFIIGGVYSLFVAGFLAIKFRPPPSTSPTTATTIQQTMPKWVTRNLPLLKKGAILSTMLLLLRKPLLHVMHSSRTMKSRELLELLSKVAFLPSFTTISPWQLLATISTTMLIYVAPMCHLVAAARLCRIQYTHDLSLANTSDEPTESQQAALRQGQGQLTERFQWRYRMNWREPQRIRTTLREYRRRLSYWFFFAGSVQEKLRRHQQDARRQGGGGGGEVKRRGLTVAQRIKQDLGIAATSSLITDRTKWKPQAMERLAKLHEQSYQDGSFYDPLGIAIHRAFDIGLGFNFDHYSNVEDDVMTTSAGESSSLSPSSRRLQARAAKSALKRAQEIYSASDAQIELDQIQDPVERNAKARELRQQADNEIKFIARRLTELIPTDLALAKERNENDDQLRPFELRDIYERTSANEYTVHRSQTIQNLSDFYSCRRSSLSSTDDADAAMYEIDYLNPSGKQPSRLSGRSSKGSTTRQDTLDKDDEFIQEWIKSEQARKDSTPTTSTDIDKDSDDRAVLA